MKIPFRFLCAVLAVTILSACAKTEEEDYNAIEQAALDAWVAQNAPGAIKSSNGMYYEVLREAEPDAMYVTTSKWLRLAYTGMTLQGDVFLTRQKQEAQIEGTYNPHTHYVPDFLYVNTTNNTMIEGLYQNLLQMKKGEVRRLYLPSRMAYSSSGTSNNVGYGGQFSLGGNKPVIIDNLEALEILSEEEVISGEETAVQEYAVDKWNMALTDTLKENFYLKRIPPLAPEADSIGVDSVVKIYYKAYFLDGFVFDTNIDSVQTRLYGESYSTSPLEYAASSDTLITAFKYAIPEVRYGEWAKMVFVSAYGYGASRISAQNNSSSSSSSSNVLYYYNPYNSYYDYYNGYYGGYYGSYYNSYSDYYYNYLYYNYLYNNSSSTTDTSTEEEEDPNDVTTEILPYSPLVFEFYVAPKEVEEDEEE